VNAVKNSTATGTTATADRPRRYRGRFAPSPTGLLHQGSLVAALASWLDARSHGGQWLLRIEDLDGPRNVPGAEDAILRTLDALGLTADGPVLRQSQRQALYREALDSLRAAGLAYRCTCSRSDEPGVYSGRCRLHPPPPGPAAWRFAMDAGDCVEFEDLIQGHCRFDEGLLGDPVIFRRDEVAAYQLAVVVDDAAQEITHVVRGADLIDSTPWQLRIGAALGVHTLTYAHVPLVTEPDGSKLAKSRRAPAVADMPPGAALVLALRLLGYEPSGDLVDQSPARILDWALAGWPPRALGGRKSVALPG
jgi:glutamyl-Q tRNA(Asp) synthetase